MPTRKVRVNEFESIRQKTLDDLRVLLRGLRGRREKVTDLRLDVKDLIEDLGCRTMDVHWPSPAPTPRVKAKGGKRR